MTDAGTVYSMLEQVGDVTIEELASVARIPKTRVRRALKQLDEEGSIALNVREEDEPA